MNTTLRVVCGIFAAFVIAACGSGDNTTNTNGTTPSAHHDGGNTDTDASGNNENDGGGDDAVTHRDGGMIESPDANTIADGGPITPACFDEQCDDDVACTDDVCNAQDECEHITLHGRCEQGSICDAERECVSPPICATVADCPDLDGPCLRESCDVASATCVYTPLDSDDDGHSPQICITVGGDDCDDSDPTIYPGASELCDEKDNDCNGVRDDLTEPCGFDKGECRAGIITCIDGVRSECQGDIGHSPEICDGLDNDCDDITDSFDEECSPAVGQCTTGYHTCTQGQWSYCERAINPTEETCDNVDNDCDGRTDDITTGCLPPIGQCSAGFRTCTYGQWSHCTREVGPSPELCDELDNDCDGITDNFTQECLPAIGVCTASTKTCTNGQWSDCDIRTVGPSPEICDELDNDCDGQTDEDWPLKGHTCDGNDTDQCKDGTYTCMVNGFDVECVNETITNIVEVCNNLDDDCDGVIDSNLPGPDCAPNIGVACDHGRWKECNCVDEIDNDGDGATDSGEACFYWWEPTSLIDAPSARSTHTALWTGTEMLVWGGGNTGGQYNPTTDTWTATSLVNAPYAQYGSTAVWTGTEMIVWGGYTNTGGRYNPTTDTWTATTLTNAPSARYGHTAIWTGMEMIVWGGNSNYGYPINTGGRYNPTTDTWTETTLGYYSAPSARSEHTAVWTGTEMIVWGGENTGTYYSHTAIGGRYNPTTDTWTATTLTNALPFNRSHHTAVWTGEEMIVWGGTEYWESTENTGGRYNPTTDTWTTTSLGPARREYHIAVWNGTEMIVWGGRTYAYTTGWRTINTGGRYNPVTNSWSPTSLTNAPSARSGHTAVLTGTGTEMIVWGGTTGSGNTNSGGRYLP